MRDPRWKGSFPSIEIWVVRNVGGVVMSTCHYDCIEELQSLVKIFLFVLFLVSGLKYSPALILELPFHHLRRSILQC